MSPVLAIAVDLLVAILLVATIVTSIGLSRRMARMKADEAGMRRTIADLMTATDTAERAISTLRATLGESDRTLGEHLRAAERHSADLATRVQAGETVMSRIAQIVEVSRRSTDTDPAGRPARVTSGQRADELARTAAAAQDLAERLSRRFEPRAAA